MAKKFLPLVLIAALLDLSRLRYIMERATQDFNIKLMFPGAMPTLADLLPDHQTTDEVIWHSDEMIWRSDEESWHFGEVVLHSEEIFITKTPFDDFQMVWGYGPVDSGFVINTSFGDGLIAVFMTIVFFLLSVFLKGGFLGSVLLGLKDEGFSIDTFVKNGIKFFGRFLWQILIILIAVLILMLIAAVSGFLGLILLITGVIVIFFMFLFWDYIIVAKDIDIIEAAKESWNLVKDNFAEVLAFMLPIVAVTAFFSILANFMVWSGVISTIVAIVGYAYFATIVIFAVMSFYLELSNKEEAVEEVAPLDS